MTGGGLHHDHGDLDDRVVGSAEARSVLSEGRDAPYLADVAEFHLAQVIGLFPDAPFMSSVKYVFGSSNPLGDALDDISQRLVDVGVLEFRDDDDEGRQYRCKVEDDGHSLAKGRGR